MKNLKPFNLQDALKGKPVMLRGGGKAYVRHHETELNVSSCQRLLGYAVDGEYLTWCENGNFISTTLTSDTDIIGMYPETRVINGFEVPAPETVAPERGTLYFVPNVFRCQLYDGLEWNDDGYDARALKRGLVFINAEDAIATAKAMLGIDPNKNIGEQED